MKILYLDCNGGAAGDMLVGALLQLHPEPDDFLYRINHIGIPGITVTAEKANSYHMQGLHIRVRWYGMEEGEAETGSIEEHVGDPAHVSALLNSLQILPSIRSHASRIISSIFTAESKAHGIEMKEIHDSRLGTMDAVADVVASCMLIHDLDPQEIWASSVRTGHGSIQCRNGKLSVPPPATEYLLKEIPWYQGDMAGELCTPTGAAILDHFVTTFTGENPLRAQKPGIGIGSRDLGGASGVQAYLGEQKG